LVVKLPLITARMDSRTCAFLLVQRDPRQGQGHLLR
jgi:hypothetical protein